MDSLNANKRHLKVLYLEDSLLDVKIIKEILPEAFELNLTHVDNEKDFTEALKNGDSFDLILSDYKLPFFTAPQALKIAKEVLPETPFICLSGTVGEERAVELLKLGGTDYILKDRMGRLIPSINRALKEASEQKELTETQKMLAKQNIELRISKEKAEESDRLKSVFFANISHEIRTPINGIMGFAELLNVNNDEDTQRQYIDIIKQSCHQLMHIIDDILELSIIDSNQLNIHKTLFDLDETFSFLYSIYYNECLNKNIELQYKNIESQYSTLYTDEKRLKQVFLNLITNSIKFTDRGTIEFGAIYNNNDEIKFYVKDTGIGIKDEHKEIIFERFRQAEEGYTRSYGGNGLGLAIVKSIINELKGDIWVNSEPKKGSTFYFTIPNLLFKEEEHIINPPFRNDSAKLEGPNYSGLNFLIVEDEINNLLFLEEVLSETNAQYFKATDGKQAVDFCINEQVHLNLIIMDVQMPIMDGLTATKKIKSFSSVPILALTAFASSIDKNKVLDSGCDGYLAKPFKKTDLFEQINKFIYKHHS